MFCKNKYIISTTQTKEKKNLNMFSTFCKLLLRQEKEISGKWKKWCEVMVER